jgi:diaminopimelate decarboxylase
MTSSHVAGSLHADAGTPQPRWLDVPQDVNALLPELWSRQVAKDADGVLTIAGLSVTEIADQVGTPAYLLDEDDLRDRARAFRTAFDGWAVFYAGKSFLCTAVARWVSEEGLGVDVCTGGELAVALRAGVDPAIIGLHGNNKSVAELRSAIEAGVGRIIVDSFDEIGRLGDLAEELDRKPRVMVRVTTGVEAHTHEYIATAHEDQKFGFSIAGGAALRALQVCHDHPRLDLIGIHSHIGSQIFDAEGFEVAARRTLRLRAELTKITGYEVPELDLGGGFGIAYTTADSPASPKQLADAMTEIIRSECEALDATVPHLSIEPGRAISGPSTFALYRVGTVKPVELDGGHTRLNERQHQDRAVRRRLLGHPGLAPVRRRAGPVPGGRSALRGRRHRRPGRVPALRHRPRRPAGGAGDGGVLPLDGQQLQPCPAAPGGRGPRRPADHPDPAGDHRRLAPARRRVVVEGLNLRPAVG